MPGLYKSTGYNLDRIELTWMWLESQTERINEKNQNGEANESEGEWNNILNNMENDIYKWIKWRLNDF